ncbi:MAG: M20/M25/M40 family metallo-hydrolase [Lentimicrobium sp.]
MRKLILIFLLLFIATGITFSQSTVADPEKKDFIATLGFLSSDWMEGREAGSKGSFMAADYVVSQMMQHGLKPGAGAGWSNSYFQDFDIIRYNTTKAEFTLIDQIGKGQVRKRLIPEVDYQVEAGPAGFQFEAPLVFAGYGISAPQAGYDEYSRIAVSGCMVVVMDGFPGEKDTLSEGWKLFGKNAMEGLYSQEVKQRNAMKNGALGIILISPDGSFFRLRHNQVNKSKDRSVFSPAEMEQSGYDDFSYSLPGDTTLIPVCWLGKEVATEMLSGSGINLKESVKRIAARLVPESKELKGKKVSITAEMKAEPILVRNVLGYFKGIDTTRSIVIGAHYDHLGMRNTHIYNGSDDNASGVAGMLALAGAWMRSGVKPPCNIIFAAWTAEEKGLLGSSWFVRNFDFNKQKVLLNVNFDMISRSSPNDVESIIVSVGLLKGTDFLKEIVSRNNQNLKRPFELDIWETTGPGGSDYAPFAMKRIPVMSFFSGYHNDYHTPRDIFTKTDPVKMEAILKLANRVILEFLSTQIF